LLTSGFVISKEQPLSGGAEFSDHVLMSVMVRVTLLDEATTLFDKATIFQEINIHIVPPTSIYRLFFSTYLPDWTSTLGKPDTCIEHKQAVV